MKWALYAREKGPESATTVPESKKQTPGPMIPIIASKMEITSNAPLPNPVCLVLCNGKEEGEGEENRRCLSREVRV